MFKKRFITSIAVILLAIFFVTPIYAGGLTDTCENEIIDQLFMNGDYAEPTSWWVALTTTTPTDSTPGTEVSGGSYARISHSAWTTAASGATQNIGSITYPDATADWNTLTHFELWTAVTGGTRCMWGALATSTTINNGEDGPIILDGGITVALD